MTKIKLDEAKELVNDNISSIYTKQDVLELLERIDNVNGKDSIIDLFKMIKVEFGNGLQCVKDSIVDKSDVTLELNGNEIYVDDIEIDVEIIEGVLEEILDNLEEDLENNNN